MTSTECAKCVPRYRVVVDWEGLGAQTGLTQFNLRNGYCAEIAWILHDLIPDSELVIGYAKEDESEVDMLEHCVVEWKDQGQVLHTYDAEGDKAIERWLKLKKADNDKRQIDWTNVSREDYDGHVIDMCGKRNHFETERLRPFVKVVLDI